MIAEALNRTILLVRTELVEETPEEIILQALRSTRVALVADEFAVSTHAGQSAYIAAAILMARQGHDVILVAPNVPLLGEQAPLFGDRLIDALADVGRDLIPGVEFQLGLQGSAADVAVFFGCAEWEDSIALRSFAVSWTDWTATLSNVPGRPKCWASMWPIGSLAAAALAAGEAFKTAMRKLRGYARHPDVFDELFGETRSVTVTLAPPGSRTVAQLGTFDLVSGGAVANAVIYTLLRLPDVTGVCRTIDDDDSALSNLNRNMMLRHSRLGKPKVVDLASFGRGLTIVPIVGRYGDDDLKHFRLADHVLMGVDDIPSRWHAQSAWPRWLGVGATDRFNVQSSYHERDLACAGCVHPTNKPIEGAIPTAAFVSFWAGLTLAVSLIRQTIGNNHPSAQQVYFCPLQPASWWPTEVAPDEQCPVHCPLSKKAA